MKTNREFFTASGKPDPATRAELERQGLERKEEIKSNPKIEKVLANFDFGLLKSILENHARSSDVNPATLNFLGPERITHATSDPDYLGGWMPRGNFIRLTYNATEEFAKPRGIDTELVLILGLCHEEVHATAKSECRGLEMPLHKPHSRHEVITGYEWEITEKEPGEGMPKKTLLFWFFNEGVVHLLAEEVFSEYSRRRGIYSEEKIAAFENLWKGKGEGLYNIPTRFIKALISRISEKTGVPKEVVWRGFIRGLYEGEDLRAEELRGLFAEYVAPDFIEKLAYANNVYSLDRLFKETFGEKEAEGNNQNKKVQ